LTDVNLTPWTLAALYFPSNRVFFLVCFGVMWSRVLATLFYKLQGSVSRHCAEGGLCWSKAKFSASKKILFSSVKICHFQVTEKFGMICVVVFSHGFLWLNH
jgi:hypothetical protein